MEGKVKYKKYLRKTKEGKSLREKNKLDNEGSKKLKKESFYVEQHTTTRKKDISHDTGNCGERKQLREWEREMEMEEKEISLVISFSLLYFLFLFLGRVSTKIRNKKSLKKRNWKKRSAFKELPDNCYNNRHYGFLLFPLLPGTV